MRRRDVLKSAGGLFVLSASSVRVRASQESTSYEPLGSVAIRGLKEAVVGPDGETVFVATTDGFATVDISTPSDPTVLAERRDLLSERANGPLGLIQDVSADGDQLLVVGPAHRRRDALHGALLYDVSDPSAPTRLAFHETDVPIHNACLRDGAAYLTGNNGNDNPLVVLDASDDLAEISRWSILDHDGAWDAVSPGLRTLHDVWVQDGIAYLAHWDAGVWFVDVSDPMAPAYVGHIADRSPAQLTPSDGNSLRLEGLELPGNVHYAIANEDASILALNREAWDGDLEDDHVGGPGGVELWDISALDRPKRLATIDPPQTPDSTYGGIWTTSHNLDIVNDRLYTSWYQGGVKIHDIADPRDPTEITWWRKPAETVFWTAKLAVPSTDRTRGFFIASSVETRAGSGNERLYTFPDEPGIQRNPPPIDATAQSDDGDTHGTHSTSSSTPSPTLSPTPSPTRSGSTSTSTPSHPGDSTTDRSTPTVHTDGQPGFGIAATLLAIGAGGLLRRIRGR